MAKDYSGKVSDRPYLVVIDPGHGGNDPGAVNEQAGLREADVNLSLALLISDLIGLGDYSYRVTLTRHDDFFVSLENRCSLANNARAAAFVSIHCNAAQDKSVRGHEVWTSPGQTKADILATELFTGLGAFMPKSKPRPDYDDGDPDKETNFYVLRHTLMPAALVEVEFISNDAAAGYLKNQANLRRIAFAMVDAIEFYLGS